MSNSGTILDLLRAGATMEELGVMARQIGHMVAGRDVNALARAEKEIRAARNLFQNDGEKLGLLEGLLAHLRGCLPLLEAEERLESMVREILGTPIWQAILSELLRAGRVLAHGDLSDRLVWHVPDAGFSPKDLSTDLERLETRALVERLFDGQGQPVCLLTRFGFQAAVASRVVTKVVQEFPELKT